MQARHHRRVDVLRHRAGPTRVARLRARSRTCDTARCARALSVYTASSMRSSAGPVVGPVERRRHQFACRHRAATSPRATHIPRPATWRVRRLPVDRMQTRRARSASSPEAPRMICSWSPICASRRLRQTRHSAYGFCSVLRSTSRLAHQARQMPSASASDARRNRHRSDLTGAAPPTTSRWRAQRAGPPDRCRRPSPCRPGRHPCRRPAAPHG